MDVNTLHSTKVPAVNVPSPVVPASAPVSETDAPSNPVAVRTDSVELSKESQVASATKELIVERNQNKPRGSRTYRDETTNRFVVEVLNSNNEVIRQIPLEETLESARRFKKLTGLIFNQEA